MKVIIAGSRHIVPSSELLSKCIKNSSFDIGEVVCGMAHGVDLSAYDYCLDRGIPVKEFPADWNQYGKSAGPMRNKQMALYADALILIWDGKSKGSLNMLQEAVKANILIYEYKI